MNCLQAGKTLLHHAAEFKCLQLAAALSQHPSFADVNLTDTVGRSRTLDIYFLKRKKPYIILYIILNYKIYIIYYFIYYLYYIIC